MAPRRSIGFDAQCWDEMGEYQRLAEVARHNAHAAAFRRYERKYQRAQAAFDRAIERARQERDEANDAARAAYRKAEDADPANGGRY